MNSPERVVASLLPSPPRLRLFQKHLQVVPIILNILNTFLYIIMKLFNSFKRLGRGNRK